MKINQKEAGFGPFFFKKQVGRVFNYDNRGRWFRSIANGMTMMCYESVTMMLM